MATPEIIAPAPMFPERTPTHYERSYAVNPVRRGPLRFQEGLGTDTDVPNEFVRGVQQGSATYPGRSNRNAKVDTKWPEETMSQRAHVGSAAWVESPQFLGEFSHGSFGDYGVIEYERVMRPYGKVAHPSPARVTD